MEDPFSLPFPNGMPLSSAALSYTRTTPTIIDSLIDLKEFFGRKPWK